jgi:hypothetical protein
LKHARIPLAEVGAEFFQQLNSAIPNLGIRICFAAFMATLFNPALLVIVEFQVVVVKFDPVISLHAAEAHGLVVVWTPSEGLYGRGFISYTDHPG